MVAHSPTSSLPPSEIGTAPLNRLWWPISAADDGRPSSLHWTRHDPPEIGGRPSRRLRPDQRPRVAAREFRRRASSPSSWIAVSRSSDSTTATPADRAGWRRTASADRLSLPIGRPYTSCRDGARCRWPCSTRSAGSRSACPRPVDGRHDRPAGRDLPSRPDPLTLIVADVDRRANPDSGLGHRRGPRGADPAVHPGIGTPWIEDTVKTTRIWATPDSWDPDRARSPTCGPSSSTTASTPTVPDASFGRILASGDRDEELSRLAVPTLVIHGSADTLDPARRRPPHGRGHTRRPLRRTRRLRSRSSRRHTGRSWPTLVADVRRLIVERSG